MNINRYAAVSTGDAVYITSSDLSTDDPDDAPLWSKITSRNFVAKYENDAWDVIGPLYYGPRIYHG